MDSTFKLGEMKFIHNMLHYGCLHGNLIVIIASEMISSPSQLTFIKNFHVN